MKDSKGHGVIRLGDQTSHGGKVISAVSDFKVLGKPVAVDGDMTFCPQCKGTYPIKTSHSERIHNGKEGKLPMMGIEQLVEQNSFRQFSAQQTHLRLLLHWHFAEAMQDAVQ